MLKSFADRLRDSHLAKKKKDKGEEEEEEEDEDVATKNDDEGEGGSATAIVGILGFACVAVAGYALKKAFD